MGGWVDGWMRVVCVDGWKDEWVGRWVDEGGKAPVIKEPPGRLGGLPLFPTHSLLGQKGLRVPKRSLQIPGERSSHNHWQLPSVLPTEALLVPGLVPGTEQGSGCRFWNDPASDSVLLCSGRWTWTSLFPSPALSFLTRNGCMQLSHH